MRRRKPRVKKEDAVLIAIRITVEAGYDVVLKAEVTDPHGDEWWTVFVPDRSGTDPGGALVKIHKQTGEAELQMTL